MLVSWENFVASLWTNDYQSGWRHIRDEEGAEQPLPAGQDQLAAYIALQLRCRLPISFRNTHTQA